MKEKIKDDISLGIEKYKKIANDKRIIALLMFIQGIFYIVMPLGSLEWDARVTVVSIFLYTFGLAIENITKTKDMKKNIIYLIIFILCIFLFIKVDIVVSILHILLGIILLLDGLNNLNKNIKYKNNNQLMYYLSIVISILTILLGIALLFNPIRIGIAIIRIVGVVLIINSISDMLVIYNIKNRVLMNFKDK